MIRQNLPSGQERKDSPAKEQNGEPERTWEQLRKAQQLERSHIVEGGVGRGMGSNVEK